MGLATSKYTDATYQVKGNYLVPKDLDTFGDQVKQFTNDTYQPKGNYLVPKDLDTFGDQVKQFTNDTYQVKGNYLVSKDLDTFGDQVKQFTNDTYQPKSLMSGYATKGDIDTIFNKTLSTYQQLAPKGDQYTLKSYTDATYQPKSLMSGYATKGDLDTFGDQVKQFTNATYQPKDTYLVSKDLDTFGDQVKQFTNDTYQPKSLMSGYATKGDLDTFGVAFGNEVKQFYQPKSLMNTYATQQDLVNQKAYGDNIYQPKSLMNTYATKLDLAKSEDTTIKNLSNIGFKQNTPGNFYMSTNSSFDPNLAGRTGKTKGNGIISIEDPLNPVMAIGSFTDNDSQSPSYIVTSANRGQVMIAGTEFCFIDTKTQNRSCLNVNTIDKLSMLANNPAPAQALPQTVQVAQAVAQALPQPVQVAQALPQPVSPFVNSIRIQRNKAAPDGQNVVNFSYITGADINNRQLQFVSARYPPGDNGVVFPASVVLEGSLSKFGHTSLNNGQDYIEVFLASPTQVGKIIIAGRPGNTNRMVGTSVMMLDSAGTVLYNIPITSDKPLYTFTFDSSNSSWISSFIRHMF